MLGSIGLDFLNSHVFVSLGINPKERVGPFIG